ncbi:MAG: hypothetical protein IJ700_07785 [Bacteroidaceae bacterium]|nr:hypothetical protein [Bacteroidaceae bacterium]
MENSILKRRLAKGASCTFAALLLLGGTMGVSSCKDELLTGMPEWLGSSIYEELEERGQFTQTLALINDPDLADAHYPELLRLTGSMTIFVADDAAWGRYLSKRGLSSVSQLSKAEKRTLLKAAMINSAYLIELLDDEASTTTDPSNGASMRRASRMELDDSIPVLYAADYPAINPARVTEDGVQIDYWADVREKPSIKLYQDATVRPMVHFLPQYMSQNAISDDDLSRLTNGASSSTERSYINGCAISLNDGQWSKDAGKTYLQDITCQNGYIHILDEVPEPLPNMAEIINSKPQFSTFAKLLERFSYPALYNILTNEDGTRDTFYQKRYFNASLNHGLEKYTPEGGVETTVSYRLGPTGSSGGFDPGWNMYQLYTGDGHVSMANDGAAMFVPTNELMQHYLHNDGSVIGAKYDYDWEKVPDNLVVPFLYNCMQSSFRSTVPSKFSSVKNTAADDMGLTAADVDSCFLACNGAVYELTSVFAAPDHQSVSFPALLFADETDEAKKMTISNRIITYSPPMYVSGTTTEHEYHKAWKLNEFQAYLSSMSSTYSFLLGVDQAFAYYVDPYSYVENRPAAFIFYIDARSQLPLRAYAYYLDDEGNITTTRATTPDLRTIANRLYDVMDNSIVVHGQRPSQAMHPGQTVYQTKAGGPIIAEFSGNTVTGLAGSGQYERGEFISVSPELTFDMTEKGNGVTYVLNALPQSTLTAPYQLMTDIEGHPEYEQFARLLSEASFVEATNSLDGHPTIGNPISLFGNYHYTVYIPKNSEIETLVSAGKLPTSDQLKEWTTFVEALDNYTLTELPLITDPDAQDARKAEIDALAEEADARVQELQDVIDNFLRFHFQDCSLYIGGADTTGVFETSAIDLELNRFRRVNVTLTNSNFQLQVPGTGITAHVINDGVHSNQMSRQYLFGSSESTRDIFSSSYVVTHLIDKALIYSDSQFLRSDFPAPVYPDWLPVPSDDPDPTPDPDPSSVKVKRTLQKVLTHKQTRR